MSKERRTLNPGKLHLDMISDGISQGTASYLMDHELKHAHADEVGRGEFGYFASGGYIVAYYFIIGPRTSEQTMDIAAAPGFSEMSDQDWRIYNNAWNNWLVELQDKEQGDMEVLLEEKGITVKPEGLVDSKILLVELMAEKLDKLTQVGRFPTLQELFGLDLKTLFEEYGQDIYKVYEEARIKLGLRKEVPDMLY